jgi:hypothetical protein
MTMEKFKRVDNTRRLCHLGIILRLVESLAAKVERGKMGDRSIYAITLTTHWLQVRLVRQDW